MDEASLIRAARQGDKDAFASLVQSYDQNVLRIAMNLLRSPEEAKDGRVVACILVLRDLAPLARLAKSEGFLLPRSGGHYALYQTLSLALADAAKRAGCSCAGHRTG